MLLATLAAAQHGAAAGQIGIWAALIAIVSWAASEYGSPEIEVSEGDVELSYRIVDVSLEIKCALRQAPRLVTEDTGSCFGSAPEVPARGGDSDADRFVEPFQTQTQPCLPLGPRAVAFANVASAALVSSASVAAAELQVRTPTHPKRRRSHLVNAWMSSPRR